MIGFASTFTVAGIEYELKRPRNCSKRTTDQTEYVKTQDDHGKLREKHSDESKPSLMKTNFDRIIVDALRKLRTFIFSMEIGGLRWDRYIDKNHATRLFVSILPESISL